MGTGNNFSDEFDIGILEIINLKYGELQQAGGQPNPSLTKLNQLLTCLKSSEVVPLATMMTHLDEQPLQNAGLLEQKVFNNKRSKAITQMMFEQQKFNLLREENEGFAKLMVELNQPNITMGNIGVVRQNVEALIGFFNLDPNRVRDLILDAFMSNLWNREPYLALLSDYKGAYVGQILGFKFHSHYEQLQAAI